MNNFKNTLTQLNTLSEVSSLSSPIHRVNPLTKFIVTIVFIVTVVSFNRYDTAGPLLFIIFPAIIAFIAKIPFNILLKRLAVVLPFVLFAAVSNLIFDTKTALIIGNLYVSYGSLSFAVIIIKTYLTVMAVLIFIATTNMYEFSKYMSSLHVPQVIIIQLSMTYRYIELLIDEASNMYIAYTLRSPKSKGINISFAGSFIGQLLLRTIDRAEAVYQTMKCRGFCYAENIDIGKKLTLSDILICFIFCIFIILLRFLIA